MISEAATSLLSLTATLLYCYDRLSQRPSWARSIVGGRHGLTAARQGHGPSVADGPHCSDDDELRAVFGGADLETSFDDHGGRCHEIDVPVGHVFADDMDRDLMGPRG